MSENRLKIGITQGDPNGIGWEVILRTFADPRMTELCTPVIYGSLKAAEFYQKTIADLEPVPFHIASSIHEIRRDQDQPDSLRRRNEDRAGYGLAGGGPGNSRGAPRRRARPAGQTARCTGHGSDRQSRSSRTTSAIRDTLNFWRPSWAANPLMMMCSDLLRMGLVTIHIPVTEISHDLTRQKIVTRLEQLRSSLKADFGIVEPRIAVLALNPHAGDGGLLGSEEEHIIRPAVNEGLRKRHTCFRPLRCRRILRQRPLPGLRRSTSHVSRSGTHAVQDPRPTG